ncbi:MAG: hypothetical protein PHG05_03725 [Candidatus Nanoarchaeia archaeon]|nr:hypothetical protein [Candidatus Nanoarchaeia archaeon]
MKIDKIGARKILNSKKDKTIFIRINGKFYGSAPSGTSKGRHEVSDYGRKGIDYAIKSLNKEKDILKKDFSSFEDLRFVEEKFSRLGGNTIIALESALLKFMSNNNVWEFLNPNAKKLPRPLGNVIGGGLHVKGNSPDIQEFLLMPMSTHFSENKKAMDSIYFKVGKKLHHPKKTAESAYSPNMPNVEVLDLLKNVIEEANFEFNFPIHIGLDMASTSFYKHGFYNYKNFSPRIKNKKLDRNTQIKYVNSLIEAYDLRYVEDPLYEEDFNGFSRIKGSLVCGDDLICTDIQRLKKAKINSVIIKPNQIGSLIKTKEIIDYCKSKDIVPVISHRSGETNDVLISHLAVAWKVPFIKTGIMGKERIAKLNELIKIEKEI